MISDSEYSTEIKIIEAIDRKQKNEFINMSLFEENEQKWTSTKQNYKTLPISLPHSP